MRDNIVTLNEILPAAEKGRYAVGSFSPRYIKMIKPILMAAKGNNSPAIVQISQKELNFYGITPKEFADEFFRNVEELDITLPMVLHLDHTKEFNVIKEAIKAGFTSVMIDASEHELNENIRITKEVAEYGHSYKVSVEAELGKIGTTDFMETDNDEELYTNPQEAKLLVEKTGVDALAVSVGTAHGVYKVRQPKVDYSRLEAIRALTPVHLVLHGGSGVPADMVQNAIKLPQGGISKVNIATDLELAFLNSINRAEKMTNAQCEALPQDILKIGQKAVEEEVSNKINNFVLSSNRA